MQKKWSRLIVPIAFFLFTSCTGSGYDDSDKRIPNDFKVQQAIEDTQNYLNHKQCSNALTSILPIYHSESTSNTVRLWTAYAYACSAKVFLLDVLQALQKNANRLGSGEFFNFLAITFFSTTIPVDDGALSGTKGATDALFAMLQTGSVVSSIHQIPTTDYDTSLNPGSLRSLDRTQQANEILALVSMAQIGILANRYGLPNSLGNPTTALPWVSNSLTTGDGCIFSSSFFNLVDTLVSISKALPISSASSMTTLETFLTTLTNQACVAGCLACGTICMECPISLRNRDSCSGTVTDVNSCIAVQINTIINQIWS